MWIVEDCAAILPQIFSVLASGQCLPVAAADLDVKTATLHYTSLVGVLELYFARVCVPMLGIRSVYVCICNALCVPTCV